MSDSTDSLGVFIVKLLDQLICVNMGYRFPTVMGFGESPSIAQGTGVDFAGVVTLELSSLPIQVVR